MQANYVQRLRLTFSKIGPTRFISHLDLARALERALNRAKIPVAYTQGFNRRPRMQFATALPLGFTSECELADILLREKMDPAVAQAQMMTRMAPGIIIHHVKEVPISGPALQSITEETTYEAALPPTVTPNELQQKIDALLDAPSIMRERRGKPYDLRPLVYDLRLEGTAADNLRLVMRLALAPGRTGRPDEVLSELGFDPLSMRIHRVALVLADA
jgi:radical SAM-linked protein